MQYISSLTLPLAASCLIASAEKEAIMRVTRQTSFERHCLPWHICMIMALCIAI